MSLALFDLDRTLIDGYAYAHLMPELWRRGIRRGGLATLVARLAIARSATRRTPLSSWWPQAFAQYLEGLDAGQFEAPCAIASAAVRDSVRAELRAEFQRHRAAGAELWLVTATVHPLAEPVAAALGFEVCISTRVAESNGRYLGSLDGPVCRGKEKLSRVREQLAARGMPSTLDDVFYYADGAEDLPLLSAVGHPVAVCPDKSLWPVAVERGFSVLGAPRVS